MIFKKDKDKFSKIANDILAASENIPDSIFQCSHKTGREVSRCRILDVPKIFTRIFKIFYY